MAGEAVGDRFAHGRLPMFFVPVVAVARFEQVGKGGVNNRHGDGQHQHHPRFVAEAALRGERVYLQIENGVHEAVIDGE